MGHGYADRVLSVRADRMFHGLWSRIWLDRVVSDDCNMCGPGKVVSSCCARRDCRYRLLLWQIYPYALSRREYPAALGESCTAAEYHGYAVVLSRATYPVVSWRRCESRSLYHLSIAARRCPSCAHAGQQLGKAVTGSFCLDTANSRHQIHAG